MSKSENDFRFKRIMVGMDGSSDSVLAFRYAVSRVKNTDDLLILCTVMSERHENVFQSLEPSFVYGESDDAVKYLNKYKKFAEKQGVKHVKLVLDEGESAGKVIIKDVIPHVEPDLLIIGSKSKKGIAKRFGSQAAYMAKYANIPVMIVR